MKILIISTVMNLIVLLGYSQKNITITIDDVPGVRKYKSNGFKTPFLDKLDSLKLPVTIFTNEGMVYVNKNVGENFELLHKWASREYVTIGNHTYNHPKCSELSVEDYIKNVKRGGLLIQSLAELNNKQIRYFRFPYNNLGKDSLHQVQVQQELKKLNLKTTPFTLDSSDWMFSWLYDYYVKKGETTKAKSIADTYINHTMKVIDFVEKQMMKSYGRNINHVYQCHDNNLNADYFHILIKKIKNKGYNFITLDETLKDKAYSQTNYYHHSWGVSWIFRWIKDDNERMKLMKQFPDISKHYKLYNKLSTQKK